MNLKYPTEWCNVLILLLTCVVLFSPTVTCNFSKLLIPLQAHKYLQIASYILEMQSESFLGRILLNVRITSWWKLQKQTYSMLTIALQHHQLILILISRKQIKLYFSQIILVPTFNNPAANNSDDLHFPHFTHQEKWAKPDVYVYAWLYFGGFKDVTSPRL